MSFLLKCFLCLGTPIEQRMLQLFSRVRSKVEGRQHFAALPHRNFRKHKIVQAVIRLNERWSAQWNKAFTAIFAVSSVDVGPTKTLQRAGHLAVENKNEISNLPQREFWENLRKRNSIR